MADLGQRQMAKLPGETADESANAGGYLLGAIVLIAGGIALFLVTVSVTAKVAGGTLAFMGVALIIGAIWVRATGS
ncbi:MAG: hypothetical protein QOG62_2129 [Thermoleophilaceae bacterium]|jgi:uncharacterized membrane protein HdeD (DUF308 family)|nr:hypothetical protein [Thermoleophilaceae bacterium]